MRSFAVAVSVFGLAGCASFVTYAPTTMDGVQPYYSGGSALQLNQSGPIIVGLGPTANEQQSGQRHTFRVFIQNNTQEPITVGPESFSILTDAGSAVAVVSAEQLEKEARRRAAMIAFGAALQAAGNSMNAANAGYYSGTGTYSGTASAFTPYGSARGVYSGTYAYSGYDAAAAAQAQAAANLQNQATMAAARARMDEAMASAEVGAFQRQTLLPGQYYVSDMTFEALPSSTKSIRVFFYAPQTRLEFGWQLSQ